MIDLNNILNELMNGNINIINSDVVKYINDITINILNNNICNNKEDEIILKISNILYNNTDRSILPLEDGVYDLLLERYNRLNDKPIVGAPPVLFNNIDSNKDSEIKTIIKPFTKLKINIDDMLYYDDLIKSKPLEIRNDPIKPINGNIEDSDNNYITKRTINTSHEYPELVGTLNKCKFVLNKQAEDKGVINDSNVRILERDFFQKHIDMGILDKDREFSMILELKYDGISVEGTVSNRILSARTRGEANEGIAADLTPILYNYPFENSLSFIPDDNIIGVKFEAIITKNNLLKFNKLKNKDYKNCRTAIVGLFSSSDAYKYRDLITLVPLASSLKLNRLVDISFLNMFYANEEYLRYAVVTGNYHNILFQIKRFVEEAEMMRDILPFMYDGVVVSYLDEDLVELLGRKNSINLYSEAVKFNPLKKQSIFRGYTYTVGQDRSITPMIHYDPVEFYGTIHNKSTGHSFDRFKDLNLKIGDIVDIEYVGDVMPYVTKPDNSHNNNNPNPIVEFTTICPACENKDLSISPTGKTVYCNNIHCGGAKIARLNNMLDKLNFKDFGQEYLVRINKDSFHELMEITLEELEQIFPGEKLAYKFLERVNNLKTKPIQDYNIVGSLGFTNIAKSTWKAILNNFTIEEILNIHPTILHGYLIAIPGIGSVKASVIIEELDYFRKDLEYINNMSNVIKSKYSNKGLKIRFTGCRDKDLVEKLSYLGHDAGEGSVTNDTDILVIPYDGYSKGSKVARAKKLGTVKLVSINNLMNEINGNL